MSKGGEFGFRRLLRALLGVSILTGKSLIVVKFMEDRTEPVTEAEKVWTYGTALI